MKKPFRLLALLMVPAIALSLSFLAACGGDDEGDGGSDATFNGATPASGSTVPAGSKVTLSFTGTATGLTASAGTIEGTTLTLPGTPGAVTITLTWGKAGSATLNYTLTEADTTPPALSGSNPGDGDSDVDPAGPNADGVTIEFSETISRQTLSIAEEGGASLGWIGSIADKVVTLKPPKGKELVNEKTYVISGEVQDASGNKLAVNISFTTKAKE